MLLATAVTAALLAAAPVDDDQLPDTFQPTIMKHTPGTPSNDTGGGHLGRQASGGVLGIDTVQSFSSSFYYPGIVPTSFGSFWQWTWPYTMVGRPPFGSSPSERTTVIDAPIIPVIIDLRNFDGSPRYFTRADGTQVRMIMDPTQYVQPVLNSPIFQNARYGSSDRPTQYTDAVHRAQFYRTSDEDWHTVLKPSVKPARTMVLIRGTYSFSINPTTGVLNYVLVNEAAFDSLLWPSTPSDTTSVIGSAENSGDITTRGIATFLFPNTFLFQGSTANCCVLGYHSYDVEPGSAANGWKERHYVLNYSSWISPGIFGGGFQDITALSHELSEIFSDPFVNNATPIWNSNGLCQNNLEDGDVIEVLPGATYPMTMNGFTYHPQNEALLQWFAGVSPSNAYRGAYSFPDTTLLTAPAISYQADCVTPANIPLAPR